MSRQKERLQFDFSLDALERLDSIKEQMGATTRAEVIRSALRCYEWVVQQLNEDDTITVENVNGELVTKFPARLLLRY